MRTRSRYQHLAGPHAMLRALLFVVLVGLFGMHGLDSHGSGAHDVSMADHVLGAQRADADFDAAMGLGHRQVDSHNLGGNRTEAGQDAPTRLGQPAAQMSTTVQLAGVSMVPDPGLDGSGGMVGACLAILTVALLKLMLSMRPTGRLSFTVRLDRRPMPSVRTRQARPRPRLMLVSVLRC